MSHEDYIAPKPWNGKDLKGAWHFTIKIDGVRAFWVKGTGWLSRAGKPLYNIPDWWYPTAYHEQVPEDGFEVYLGSLKDTVRAVRTQTLKEDTPRVTKDHLYCLNPLDPRLTIRGVHIDPTAEFINAKLAEVNAQGFEGLVLRSGNTWLKVKPADTYDVLVLGIGEGEGKHRGRMGYLITHMGEVGTGFTDKERAEWWKRFDWIEGALRSIDPGPITIEVECMHLTPDGKFRHPRFVRERFDKVAEK